MQKIVFEKVNDFSLKQTFECGQCFRWKENEDGSYTGVIKEGVLNVKKEKNNILICGEVDGNLKEICINYFDLERDYGSIKKKLCINDDNMKIATKFGEGIRILNQDSWEMLISFIISAANNIPRISKAIENISKQYGSKIIFEDEDYYLFPTPKQLKKASIQDLRELKLGFRDKYIFEATRMINDKEIDLNTISKMKTDMAKKELTKIPGVGEKVADCIMLFSMKKIDAFPVDTWIKKVMNELYIDSTNITKINKYAIGKFGEYAGIAQQYLFYYKRSN